MVKVGNDDVYAFNFTCSSTSHHYKYWVYKSMFPNSPLDGSVTMGLGEQLLNGTPLDIYTSNGYVVVKAVNDTSKILVIDPETGIVRDILPNSVIFGSYCYYDLQTELAVQLGHTLITTGPEWLANMCDLAITLGSTLAYMTHNAGGPPNWDRYFLAFTLISGGVVTDYLAFDLNRNVDPQNLAKFLIHVGVSVIPIFGTGGGAVGDMTLSYFTQNGFKTTVTSISQNFEGYVITVLPVKLGEVFVGGNGIETGFVASLQYIKYGTVESVIKTAFGSTAKEAVGKFIKDESIKEGLSFIIDEGTVLVDDTVQYTSQTYNNINNYLSTP